MNQCSKASILFWTKKIDDYLRNEGFQIDPLPEVILADEYQQKNDTSDVLISTGGYQPESKTVVLYTDNRHIKDILRSYCHEMVHHHQNLDNSDYMRRVYTHNIIDSLELEELEAEAYLKGNLFFRKFTEKLKKQIEDNSKQK